MHLRINHFVWVSENLSLTIPWTNLYSESVEVSIDGLYALAVPNVGELFIESTFKCFLTTLTFINLFKRLIKLYYLESHLFYYCSLIIVRGRTNVHGFWYDSITHEFLALRTYIQASVQYEIKRLLNYQRY